MAKGKITKRRVDAMEPGNELWDTELKGFGIRCRAGDVRSYMLMYRIGKRQRRYTIGRHGVLTTDQARTEAKRLLGLVASGKDPAADRSASRGATIVGKIIDEFLEKHVTKKKPNTQREYRRILEKRIRLTFGTMAVTDISRPMVADWHQKMVDTPREANHSLSVMSKLMSFAESREYRPDNTNPCRHVERYRENKRKRYLKPEEIARLHNALSAEEAEGATMPSSIQCIWLLHLTGARRSEALGLTWGEVDFKTRCINLSPERNKTNQEKKIYLSAAALELLRRIPRIQGNPHVFAGRKAGVPLRKLDEAWRKICKRAKLDDVHLHDLRHTWASLAVGAGMSLPKLGKALGHLTPSTTQRYH